MAHPANVSNATSGGDALSTTVALISYYTGSPGNSYLPIGTTCPESQAAGGAVTHVAADKACKGVQGLRIIIGDTFDSVHSGFEMTNFNFHCAGTQPSISATWAMNGPAST